MSDQKIIIFDGPDGCGKTNIAAALSRLLDIPVFKNEFEWDHFNLGSSNDYFIKAIEYQHPYVLSFLKQTRHSAIFDRAHPSEFAYSRVFERTTSWRALKMCDDMSAEMSVKIIIPYRTNYENVDDEFGVNPIKLVEIESEYRAFAKWTKCDVMWLNVDDEDLDREIKEIVDFLEMV